MTLQDRPQDQHRQIIVAPSALHSASTLQITATLIGAIFIVSFVLYGINNQRDEGAAPQTTAAAALATPQPANAQQNNPAFSALAFSVLWNASWIAEGRAAMT